MIRLRKVDETVSRPRAKLPSAEHSRRRQSHSSNSRISLERLRVLIRRLTLLACVHFSVAQQPVKTIAIATRSCCASSRAFRESCLQPPCRSEKRPPPAGRQPSHHRPRCLIRRRKSIGLSADRQEVRTSSDGLAGAAEIAAGSKGRSNCPRHVAGTCKRPFLAKYREIGSTFVSPAKIVRSNNCVSD